MAQLDPVRVAREAAHLLAARSDPVTIAIHVEEACGTVLPDALITREHLGSVDAILRTIRAVEDAR